MSDRNRASSDAASSRYGIPSSRALGRIESSTSVTLRTIRTSWPSSSSRRVSRSYARYVAACPRWVESYGVMPQTYIRTVGPTVERDDTPLAPCRRCAASSGARGLDAREPERGLPA